jgi:CBS domain-containing protein
MNIGEACTREAYIVSPGEPLLQAVREMCRRNVGCVIVVERRAALVVPVGIVTDRDVVRVLPSRPGGLGEVSVAEVMSRDLFTLGEQESIVDAMERLRRRGVRRAPVIGASGDLLGIISTDDLLGIVAEQLGSLARLVGAQTRSHRG